MSKLLSLEDEALIADGLRYRELIVMHEGEFPQFREQLQAAESSRDHWKARAERAEVDAKRWAFCVERGVFPKESATWGWHLPNCGGDYHKTPQEAVDEAMEAKGAALSADKTAEGG